MTKQPFLQHGGRYEHRDDGAALGGAGTKFGLFGIFFLSRVYLIEIQTFSGDPADLGQNGRSHRLNRELLQPGKEKLASTCIGVNC